MYGRSTNIVNYAQAEFPSWTTNTRVVDTRLLDCIIIVHNMKQPMTYPVTNEAPNLLSFKHILDSPEFGSLIDQICSYNESAFFIYLAYGFFIFLDCKQYKFIVKTSKLNMKTEQNQNKASNKRLDNKNTEIYVTSQLELFQPFHSWES